MMPNGYGHDMQQTTMPATQQILPAGMVAPTGVPDVVSVSALSRAPRSAMVDERLIHGLLRFPLGEAADTRQPRW